MRYMPTYAVKNNDKRAGAAGSGTGVLRDKVKALFR